MGILRRVRDRGEAFVARRLRGRALALSAAIPWRHQPICEVRVEAESTPQADGERVRIRAHLHLRLPLPNGAPGTRDVNSWIEVRASNASLDEGSSALVPEKLEKLGVSPRSGKPVQTWAGALGRGFAVLTLLKLDKANLPSVLRSLLGARPFQLSATAVSVVEDHR